MDEDNLGPVPPGEITPGVPVSANNKSGFMAWLAAITLRHWLGLTLAVVGLALIVAPLGRLALTWPDGALALAEKVSAGACPAWLAALLVVSGTAILALCVYAGLRLIRAGRRMLWSQSMAFDEAMAEVNRKADRGVSVKQLAAQVELFNKMTGPFQKMIGSVRSLASSPKTKAPTAPPPPTPPTQPE